MIGQDFFLLDLDLDNNNNNNEDYLYSREI